MYSTNMFPSRQTLLCSLILCISFPYIRTSALVKKFNITLKTPGNTTAPTAEPHKSVHVRYSSSNDKGQGTIVGFEPLIQIHQKAIEQMTVHLCATSIPCSIWYDDETICNGVQSMLIYEWTPYSLASSFRIVDGSGFEFNDTQSIVLTVIYRKERRLHKEQSGIILYLSNQPPKFAMGTMLVGHQHKGTHFSCRSSNFPRLLYAVKKLNSNENKPRWRIHIIRVRQFGRKLVQPVLDSKTTSTSNQTHIEMTLPDIFLLKGDYLFIDCDNIPQSNCYFLIYYTYKSKVIKNNHMCQNDSFPSLFKLIPSREPVNTNQTTANSFSIDGSTVFLILFILLIIAWISIIVGCVIVRRIRGLVNFRTEPVSSLSSQKSKYLTGGMRGGNDGFQRAGDTDHINQIDADHGGGMS